MLSCRFEGFDEYAHYSSIRQIADAGTLPLFGNSFIDRNVERYLAAAPTPWGTLHPPFEQPGRMTYPAFFKNAKAVADYRDNRYRSADWDFAPGATGNWESQHPPLYYVLMAPIMKATEGLSPRVKFFPSLEGACLLPSRLDEEIAWQTREWPRGFSIGAHTAR